MNSETYLGYERRQALRIKFDKEAELKGKTVNGREQTLSGSFVNLSEGGACLRVNAPFVENTELKLNFRLPGLLHIYVRSTVKVVWCILQPAERSYLLGVSFTTFDSSNLTTVRSFVFAEAKRNSRLQA